jgi:chromosome partitioning protein
MILVSGGIKGGSGKTTVATNLAIMRALAGRDVLLVDADDQETATDFTVLRNERREGGAGYTNIKLSGTSVRTEVQRLKNKYDDIIIDTGGRDTTSQRAALTVADVLLVPFVPRSFDIWTIEKISDLVGEIRAVNSSLQAYTFINRADSHAHGHDNNEAAEVLREVESLEYLDAALVNRKAFGDAAGAGQGVIELSPSNPKASEEIERLYTLVFESANSEEQNYADFAQAKIENA